MAKTFKGFVVPILALFFSILIKIATSSELFDYFLCKIVAEAQLHKVKQIIDIIDYSILVLPLGMQSIFRAKRAARYNDVISNFANTQRELISRILNEQGYIVGTSDDINIRIFKKRFNRLVLEDKMKFCARDINGKLSFSIKKKEGLCTRAYCEGHSMLEIEDGSRVDYNLNDRQRALAGQLKFIVAVPIHLDNTITVKRVICFDSFQKIAKNGCEEGILKICESIAYHLNSVID